jgi:predicted transposase YdaD
LSLAEQRGLERGRQEGEERGLAKGQVLALAQAVLTVLSARQLQVNESLRTQILAATDPATLSRWLARASTIASAEELFQP